LVLSRGVREREGGNVNKRGVRGLDWWVSEFPLAIGD
jgi:hypothetical protein